MPRKKLTQDQEDAFNLARTATWLDENGAVNFAFLKYITKERTRSGLGLKEVVEKARKDQEKGYLPQNPGKKGYKPLGNSENEPIKEKEEETP